MKKNKILLVIPYLQSGGMERVMSELAFYFCQKPNLETHLVLYGMKREIFYSVPGNLIIHYPNFIFNNKLRFWNTLKTLFFLRYKVNKIKPNTVLSFGEYWNNLVLIATLGLGFPVFVSDRCQPDKSLGKFHDSLRKLLYPKATGVIAQTSQAKDIYSRMFQHKNISVIGNPIRNIPANSGLLKENIILNVGRLIKTKHHDELIKVFAELNRRDWKLVIVGSDALKQTNKVKLQNLINSLNLSDNVFLAGKRNDVEEFYLKSKIFAFSSSSEGFPNVIGEAMSAGIPVVTFDCIAGPSDMIQDGKTGFLVPLFDYKLFSERLLLLMNEEDLRNRIGISGQESIKNFSTDIIGEKFLNFILKPVK